MADWLILAAANVLKSAIVGGLALVSWTVHELAPCRPGPTCLEMRAVPGAESTARVEAVLETRMEAEQDIHARLGALRVALIRVQTAVPPIRVETFFAPDVLTPAGDVVPPAVAARIHRERPAQAG